MVSPGWIVQLTMTTAAEAQDSVSTAPSEVLEKTKQHLHSHLLLYTQVSDSKQILYTLQCIKNILQSNPRLCIAMLSTTSLNNNANSSRSFQIQTLLARFGH